METTFESVMGFERTKDGSNTFRVNSRSGERYYIVVLKSWFGLREKVFCSCPDFTIGRPSRGIDPHKSPCKHIKDFKRGGASPDRRIQK